MSQGTIEKLAHMANQIGDFHAVMSPEEGAAGVATHIRKFWTPKMIAQALAAREQQKFPLNETSARGFAILKQEFASAT